MKKLSKQNKYYNEFTFYTEIQKNNNKYININMNINMNTQQMYV